MSASPRYRPPSASPLLHRLLVVGLAALVLPACVTGPSIKEQRAARSHFDLGSAKLREGNPRGALESYMKARDFDPHYAPIHNALGLVLHNSFKRYPEAIAAYQKALELKPDFLEAYNNLGTVYLEQERYEEAIVMFRKPLEDVLYKTPWIAEVNLGWALHQLGRKDEAREHLERAVFLDPTFCQAHRNLGLHALDTGDVEQAAMSFAAYADRCPKEPEAFYRLGISEMRRGGTEQARTAFQRCTQVARRQDAGYGKECRKSLELLD